MFFIYLYLSNFQYTIIKRRKRTLKNINIIILPLAVVFAHSILIIAIKHYTAKPQKFGFNEMYSQATRLVNRKSCLRLRRIVLVKRLLKAVESKNHFNHTQCIKYTYNIYLLYIRGVSQRFDNFFKYLIDIFLTVQIFSNFIFRI